MRHPSPHRQQGAVIITACLLLLMLLGFMGFALDFGKLFVVKSELQTAMDSCALAAAKELNGLANTITRATNAGRTAGNLNRVNFQSNNWSGQGQLVDANITFRDAAFALTTSDTAAKYVQCQHIQPSVQMWLLKAMGAFTGNTADFPTSHNVMASAVATLASAQSTCPIPIAFKPPAGGTKANNYLLQVGQWVKVVGDKLPNSGEIGWYNLDGTTSASAAKDELEGGSCGNKVGDTLGTPGAKSAVDVVWNYRFGVYKGSGNPADNHPDFSGYAYTSANWKNPVPQNAWDGTPAAGSDPTAANFVTKRAAFASLDNTGTSLKDGSRIAFGDQNKLNSFSTLATPGSGGQHAQFGADRRVATVPVINGANQVTDYICMFLLHPLTGPSDDAYVEFRGSAALPGSPCSTVGFPGGAAGPLVPALVR